MKFFLAIAFIIACIGVEVWGEPVINVKSIKAVEQCVAEADGLTKEDLQKLRDNDFEDGKTPKHVKCYVKCILEALEFLDDDDAIKEDLFIQVNGPLLGQKKAQELYDSCKNETGKGKCEKTYNIVSCLRNKEKFEL